jgi:hypothetical protein
MTVSKKKLLIDTSAVPPAIGQSSGPHIKHFENEVEGATLCTSTYIRKETLRLWVCEVIELAQLVDMSPTVSDAFGWWKEHYGRQPKLQGFVDSAFLREQITLTNEDTHGAALELAQFALDLIDKFDLTFKSRTQNSCGCQIGGVEVDADGNALMTDLPRFRREFLKEVVGCPINGYLQIENEKGRAAKFVACEHLDKNQSTRALRAPLMQLVEAKKEIRCIACGSIGDQVIAMEQPAAYTLIHTDNSFNTLCKCTSRNHHQIRSNASFQPKIPKDEPVVEAGGNLPDGK